MSAIAEVISMHAQIGRDGMGQYCAACHHRYRYAAERKLNQLASEHVAERLAAAGYGKLAEARAAELEAAAESLEWVQPEKSPCGDCSQCCGSEASCDAMRPSRSVVGSGWLRDRAAAIRAGEA